MKNITDEMLNDYIDNNLSKKEIDEINEELEVNEDLLNRLKALKSVDRYLNTLEFDKAPSGIKNKVMNKIASLLPKKQKNPFFRFILSIFGFGILGVTVFSIISVSGAESDSSQWDKIKSFISEKLPTDLSIFNNFSFSNNTILIAASLTILLLFIFYYLVNSHKTFKEQLKSYGQ